MRAMNTTGKHSIELWMGPCCAGIATQAFYSAGTWCGIFNPSFEDCSEELVTKFTSYIEFCQDWHERLTSGDADPLEFEQHSDIVHSGNWTMRQTGSATKSIADAPVF